MLIDKKLSKDCLKIITVSDFVPGKTINAKQL